jgi:endonuclease YncB( thermonuclease family)
MIIVLGLAASLALLGSTPPAEATRPSCVVDRVIDGDTFVCDDGAHVRMLQINAPELSACGGAWAGAALRNIFLRPGTHVRLDHDKVLTDRYGRDLAAPIVVGTDGAEYNISIVMVYVGLAKAAYYGDNAQYLEWARASETWARTAQWNMWAPGGPFNGGTRCG